MKGGKPTSASPGYRHLGYLLSRIHKEQCLQDPRSRNSGSGLICFHMYSCDVLPRGWASGPAIHSTYVHVYQTGSNVQAMRRTETGMRMTRRALCIIPGVPEVWMADPGYILPQNVAARSTGEEIPLSWVGTFCAASANGTFVGLLKHMIVGIYQRVNKISNGKHGALQSNTISNPPPQLLSPSFPNSMYSAESNVHVQFLHHDASCIY